MGSCPNCSGSGNWLPSRWWLCDKCGYSFKPPRKHADSIPQEVRDILDGTEHCKYCGKVHRIVTLSECKECGARLCNFQAYLGDRGYRHMVYKLRGVHLGWLAEYRSSTGGRPTVLYECGPTEVIERFEVSDPLVLIEEVNEAIEKL